MGESGERQHALLGGLVSLRAFSAEHATITLSTSANPVLFGQMPTLTAAVSPTGASGRVTFYDGTTMLGAL